MVSAEHRPADRSVKTVLITGGTSGIGFHAARLLAASGHEVMITGRDIQAGEQAAARIRAGGPPGRVWFLAADHSTVGGNQTVAAHVAAVFPRLDVLINNVGGLYESRWETADGYEATLAMNVVGPFTLTIGLLPVLEANAPGRCINVVSAAFKMHKGDPFDDVQSTRRFVGSDAYAKTKLLNLLFALASARQHDPAAVTVNSVHPGMAWTGMTQAMTPRTMPAARYLWPLLRLVQRSRSPERSARRLVALATAPGVESVTGGYFEGRLVPESLSSRELDVANQDRAWQLAAALVHQAPTGRPHELGVDANAGAVMPPTRSGSSGRRRDGTGHRTAQE